MDRSLYLFNLVKSLSKQEKRHLRLYANAQAGLPGADRRAKAGLTAKARRAKEGDRKYMLLFDAIDRQKKYDEEKLRRRFAGEPFARQFPVAKNYLYNLIIRNMLAYHGRHNTDARVRSAMSEAEYLHRKGLLAECRRAVGRSMKLGYRYEKYAFLLGMVTWEMDMFRIDFDLPKVESYGRLQDRLLANMENVLHYRRLKTGVFALYKKHYIVRSSRDLAALEKLVRDPLLKSEDRAATPEGRAAFHYVWGYYYLMKGAWEKCHRHRARQIEILETAPDFMRSCPEEYAGALNNAMAVARYIRNHPVFLTYAEKMKSFTAGLPGGGSDFFRLRVAASLLAQEPAYWYMTGEPDRGLAVMEGAGPVIARMKTRISGIRLLYIYFSFMRLCISAGRFEKALQWLNIILNNYSEKDFPDYIVICRLAELIVHYEMGNAGVTESLMRSTYRYLHKRKRLYRAETAILAFLKGQAVPLSAGGLRGDLAGSFRELNKEFGKLKKDAFEQNFFGLFAFDAWLESKLRRVPMHQVMKERSGDDPKLKSPGN